MLAMLDISRLSPSECILLAEQLWEHARTHPGAVPITDAQRTELKRRVAALDCGEMPPEPGAPGMPCGSDCSRGEVAWLLTRFPLSPQQEERALPFRLFKQSLELCDHLVHDDLRHALHECRTAILEVEHARLVAKHHALGNGADTH